MTLDKAEKDSVGSWLSQSWLAAFTLPGSAISDLLMATLLENDATGALDKIGNAANLRGGFVLDNHSWWSKYSVVSRVLGSLANSTECMGWVKLPKDIRIIYEERQMRCNGWIDVQVDDVPETGENARLFDGPKMSLDSSPLGTGRGKVMGSEFIMPVLEESSVIGRNKITFHALAINRLQDVNSDRSQAVVEFKIRKSGGAKDHLTKVSFRLQHDVWYVCAQPCRLPNNYCFLAGKLSGVLMPAHPLHKSYTFEFVRPEDLPAYLEPGGANSERKAITIIDARASPDSDSFARAWCCQLGRHALIARESRVCISCCVREAKALRLDFIIYLGRPDGDTK